MEDASKARTLMENLSGVQMAESINVTLGDHATYFTASYHKITKLVQSNAEDDADYAPIIADVTVRRRQFGADLSFGDTVAVGIHKVKKSKAKVKSKA